MKKALLAATLLFAATPAWAQVRVVAAENFYGDLVQQLGGAHVAVTSILSNPNDDPHLFEASPGTARAIAGAQLVVYNGVDYDPWMSKLLSASPSTSRVAVVAGEVTHHKAGDNPHLWYQPATMPAVAQAVAAALKQADPADAATFDANLASFVASLQPMTDKLAALRTRYAGTPVTATEPVFGYMSDAIGLAMRNPRFQLAIMNDAEPSPSDVAAFQKDLAGHAVRVLFYNSQATENITKHMQTLAQESGIPIVGVTETEPLGTNYQAWMTGQLEALDKALNGATAAAR